MATEYYIRVQGRVEGPLSLERIRLLVKRRQFSRFHEVSTDGKTWSRAGNDPTLFAEPPKPVSRPGRPSDPSVPEPDSSVDWLAAGLESIDGAGDSQAIPGEHDVSADAQAADDGWYYLDGESQQGPVLISELKALLESSRMGPEHYVWHPHLESWSPVSRVPRLAGLIPASHTGGPVRQAGTTAASTTGPTGVRPSSTTGTAVASLVCALAGLACLPIVGSIAAVVLSHSAIKRRDAGAAPSSTATVGLILGYTGLVFWGLICIVLTVRGLWQR